MKMVLEEKPPPSKSVDSYVREYCQYTTTHGFSRLSEARDRGVSWHVFWIFMLIGAHSLFYYHTYLLIQDYMAKPIRTKVTMRHGKNLAFPTVTICNQNCLRKSKVSLDFKNEITRITRAASGTKTKNTTRKSPSKSALPDPDLKHAGQTEWELIRNLFNKYDTNELKEYGHQLEDMILDCSFNGEDCTPGSSQYDETFTWRHIWLDEVGNCYMFNRGLDDNGKNVDVYRSTLPGDMNGLKLLLNVEQYEYLEDISPYAGIRVAIATQGQMPFPQSHGIDLAPGFSTSIELRKNHITRLDPFSNICEKTGKLETASVFRLYNMTYSKMACKMSCLILMQTHKCKCAQFHLATIKNYRFCDYSNTTTTECLNDVYSQFLDGICDTKCPPPCSEIYFTTTISSSKWPSNSYKKRLNESLKNDYRMSMTEDEISDNLIEMHVYFADLDYVHVEETLKYEFQDIISNVGGQLGMWIGVSALSIAEVIELFIIVVNFLINKRKTQSVVNVQNIDVAPHQAR